MAYMICDILNDVKNAKDKQLKIEILRNNDSPTLREILKVVYNGIQCVITDVMLKTYGCDTYTFSGVDATVSPSNLYKEQRNLFIFYKQNVPINIPPKDLAKRWYYMMMLLSKEDGAVLENWRYGRFQTAYNLTPDVVYYAFPHLINYQPIPVKEEPVAVKQEPIKEVKQEEIKQEEVKKEEEPIVNNEVTSVFDKFENTKKKGRKKGK